MADSKLIEKLEKVLSEDVRPALLEHEGGVELISCEDGIVKVKLLGKCAGCPSAYLTTEELIAAKVKARMPEIRDVVLVQEVSEDLMNFARDILSHKINLRENS